MRPACSARIPLRTIGWGCIITIFKAGVRHARAKGCHGDAIAFEFAMKGFGEAKHVGFCGGVAGEILYSLKGQQACDT